MLVPVTEHPRASLGRVLEDLGSTLLELLCGDADRSDGIDGVIIHDPLDEPAWSRHALVLGVGVNDPEDVIDLLGELGSRGGVGLVLRSPVRVTPEIAEAAKRTGVAVLGLARGASWVQLAAMLRSLLAHDDVAETRAEMLGGVPSGDLFALANAVAALLDAPITIEDRASRVLAFSGRQDEADPSRIGTILNRRVSVARTRDLEDRGVFRELYRTDQPLFVEPPESGLEGFTMPRMALAVRAGDEILGSIWAAVREPFPGDRVQAFSDVGKLVALHLLSHRAGADVERRLRSDLVATALEGGPEASQAAGRLGLSHQPAVVLALALPEEADASSAHQADRVAERQRLGDSLAMHLTAAHPGSAAALVGNVAYGIVPVGRSRDGAERGTARLAAEFLDRTRSWAPSAAAGIGTVTPDASGLSRSRDGADRALRVALSNRTGRRVACIGDVGFDALLIELADLIAKRGDPLAGPVARLLAYDEKHRSRLVETMRAWLDAFGDVIAAAQAVNVHPNTFRYRLRRLAEVGELDLGDPDTRLTVMLQLRLMADQHQV
ncbi:helix-turn-helix domain-containing protein [Actinomadura sp. DC4]|uniref:PucR family transcriptional regulator n=1 Tax=Actinomadura sp. DC4 TaxID=3055069 RepID=UPI0025B0122B|nr:helix-turn-helix domain-containing protein [Actinomadura sp. DC4]MDN3353653.1 helix-turn-helix domain-containing protein [Actinomadura sp. DC4]